MKAIYLHSRDNARTPMPWDGSEKVVSPPDNHGWD